MTNIMIMSHEKVYISLIFALIWTMLTSFGEALTQQNWKKKHYLQKQAARIIFNKDQLCHS